MGIGVRLISGIKTAIRAGEFKRSEMTGVNAHRATQKTLLTLERLERQAASLELLPVTRCKYRPLFLIAALHVELATGTHGLKFLPKSFIHLL